MVRTLFLSLALIAAATSGQAAEKLVVIAATLADQRITTGALLGGGDEVVLQDGERLTLMAEDGTITTLSGPRAGAVIAGAAAAKDGDWPAGLTRVAGFVSGAGGQTNVLGASRDPDAMQGIAIQESLWHVNVDSSGERCLKPGELTLWRRNAERPASVTVRGERERLPQKDWAEGDNTMTLPARLAQDGDRLVLSLDGMPRRYTLHVLPETIGADHWGPILQWMIAKDCKRQAVLLIGALHDGTIAKP